MRRGKKWLIAVAVILAVLIGVRLALPTIVTRAINRQLHALEAYDGHIDGVHLALWRGAYRIDGMHIDKKGAERPIPFFSCPRLDISVQWRALLHGSLASELVIFSPQANLVRAANEQQSQLGTEEDWPQRLRKIFPFKFNSIQVRDGTLTFTAPGIRTQDAVKLQHLNGWVTNLTNVVDSNEESFAGFKAEGVVLDDAHVKTYGRMDPLAERPTFEVHLSLEGVQLPKLNPWLRQYVKADAEAGDFQLYMEVAAADGKFEGYAKPLMQHVDLYRSGEDEESPLKKAWEATLDFANDVLKNDEKDQLGARIPFRGEFHDADAGLFESIISVLHNGFIQAFAQSLEGSISLRKVKRDLHDIGEGASGDEQRARGEGKDEAKDKDEKAGKKRSEANSDSSEKAHSPHAG